MRSVSHGAWVEPADGLQNCNGLDEFELSRQVHRMKATGVQGDGVTFIVWAGAARCAAHARSVRRPSTNASDRYSLEENRADRDRVADPV